MKRQGASDISGSVAISLLPHEAHHEAHIRSERPHLASRVFEGKAVNHVLPLVPLLFSVCGQAQSVAAVRAVENAMQKPASAEVERRRDYLLALEGLREHLWRFYIDWPKLLGQRGQPSTFAPMNQSCLALSHMLNPDKRLTTVPGLQSTDKRSAETFATHWRILKHTVTEQVFADTAFSIHDTEFAPNSDAAVLLQSVKDAGWARLGDVTLPPLHKLPADTLARILRSHISERFACRPTWQGRCYETGPFARQQRQVLPQVLIAQYGPGALARMATRLTELLHMMHTIDAGLSGASLFRPRAANTALGVAQVEAARGRLIHYVELADTQVTRYRIVAPTEWNFHPEGILARMLNRLPQKDEKHVRRSAELLIKLADPCVGHELHLPTPETRHCHA